MRGFAAFSGLLMVFGFLALFGAIGYRVVVGWESEPDTIEGTVRLPAGAQVRSAVASRDIISVTVERNGMIETHFFDTDTRAPRGVLNYANEP